MIRGCMSGKGHSEMTIITVTLNVQVYIEIWDTFDEVIFQYNNAVSHRAKRVKAFPQETTQ